jgi:hypothetical protein
MKELGGGDSWHVHAWKKSIILRSLLAFCGCDHFSARSCLLGYLPPLLLVFVVLESFLPYECASVRFLKWSRTVIQTMLASFAHFEFWKSESTATYFPFVFWSVLFYAIYVKRV